jgi:twitching motility two-component system response regulator PilH
MKVLIVDDTATDRALIKAILTKHGHQVLEADNGQKGVEMAKAEKPDVTLMDIVMPEMNGFQATRLITSEPDLKNVRVFMVSSKSQRSDLFRAESMGAKGYLVKPPSEAELLKLLAQ